MTTGREEPGRDESVERQRPSAVPAAPPAVPNGGEVPRACAEDHLAAAMRARSDSERLAQAQRGLAFPELEPDTRMLLLRQAYVAHVARAELEEAAEAAAEMCATGAMPDIACHDHARVLRALGRTDEAIARQAEAAALAPRSRRTFHLWSLATLQHFSGAIEDAMATLERGIALDGKDRPLLEAHRAWIALSEGIAVIDLQGIRASLRAARAGQGYGQFVLGMLAFELGDLGIAGAHLRAFLRRNASVDAAKELTLREELDRARRALATFASS